MCQVLLSYLFTSRAGTFVQSLMQRQQSGFSSQFTIYHSQLFQAFIISNTKRTTGALLNLVHYLFGSTAVLFYPGPATWVKYFGQASEAYAGMNAYMRLPYYGYFSVAVMFGYFLFHEL